MTYYISLYLLFCVSPTPRRHHFAALSHFITRTSLFIHPAPNGQQFSGTIAAVRSCVQSNAFVYNIATVAVAVVVVATLSSSSSARCCCLLYCGHWSSCSLVRWWRQTYKNTKNKNTESTKITKASLWKQVAITTWVFSSRAHSIKLAFARAFHRCLRIFWIYIFFKLFFSIFIPWT